MKLLNVFGKTICGVAVLAVCPWANAAQNGRASMMPAVDSARMPTMPTVSLNTIGSPAVTTIDMPAEIKNVNNVTPTPEPTPEPKPEPKPECPDGGVKNSDYTVSMCMNDVLQCINTGALQGGLNDLFNEDVRNGIMSGMRLCQVHIDKCITDVRVNCRNVYNESNDVWLDFNSRIIQPEYYNFVLRKTGLTPNQAENTCLLLDRNTYGPSFAAVSDVNAVNSEYNRKVGAYNISDGGKLSKKNPQGVEVNTIGYDGNRGHYARWDASNAECLVRVAAYNKDKLITNNWLFGAMGNDQPAEVWKTTGTSFTCNRDLFDMSSLLNDTRTVAVVGIGGGTLVGAGVGAAVGASNYKKKHNAYLASGDLCADPEYVKKLGAKIYASGQGGVLKSFAGGAFDSVTNFNDLNEAQCNELHELSDKVGLYESVIEECLANDKNRSIAAAIRAKISAESNTTVSRTIEMVENGNKLKISQNVICDKPAGISESDIRMFEGSCTFKPLREFGAGAICETPEGCLTVNQIQFQVSKLKSVFATIEPETEKPQDAKKGKEIGKGIAIGAATGATAGGIATAITALVERSNITCKVGDGLESVAMGKAHTIDSLKDFYVKWNLRLPDAITPTSAVIDAASWVQACAQFNNKLMDCPRVQINLKDAKGKYTLVESACRISGNICTTNDAVMLSNGIE